LASVEVETVFGRLLYQTVPARAVDMFNLDRIYSVFRDLCLGGKIPLKTVVTTRYTQLH
jgi:hypothetical protein